MHFPLGRIYLRPHSAWHTRKPWHDLTQDSVLPQFLSTAELQSPSTAGCGSVSPSRTMHMVLHVSWDSYW